MDFSLEARLMKSLGFAVILSLGIGLGLAHAQNIAPLLQDRLYLKVDTTNSTVVIVTEDLRKLYQFNGMANFWITSDSKPNESAIALKEILSNADHYGLKPAHYWSSSLDSLFNKLNDRNAITFELMLSDSYFRFARDLANGQVLDPDLIDEDIKMTRKPFEAHATLAEAAKSSGSLQTYLSTLSPQHNNYKKLLLVLEKFKKIESASSWGPLADPGADIKPGQSHSSLPEIKKRLSDMGYGLLQNRTAVFDAETQAAVKKFQELNRLPVIKNISRSFYASLIPSISDRIERINANLEKFRWFPNQWEDRYLFVNLAFQELSIFEAHNPVLKMKTVVGRPTRRTPTLRDEIRFIELNPTWTSPISIVMKDKIPLLQQDAYALENQNIWIFDQDGDRVNPTSVDWYQYGCRDIFDSSGRKKKTCRIPPYNFVQQPGANNALGLVKFPLTNPWFIYLHDTNEPHLMKESNRLRSSGCVRLEKPFDLVQYLLRDQSDWPLSRVRSQRQAQMRLPVKKYLPVYFMYQTVDITEAGEIRMAPDDYGQDQRLIELFKSRGSSEKF